jgi:hypothetical protein
MEHLNQILKNKNFDEPREIKIIKDFIRENFDDNCLVKINSSSILIVVSNSSLAGALRERLQTLKKIVNTDKKLFIRTGQV